MVIGQVTEGLLAGQKTQARCKEHLSNAMDGESDGKQIIM